MRRFALLFLALVIAAVAGAAAGYGLRSLRPVAAAPGAAPPSVAPATLTPLTPAPVAAATPVATPPPAPPAAPTAPPAAVSAPARTAAPPAAVPAAPATPAAVATPAPVAAATASPAPVAAATAAPAGPQILAVDLPSVVHPGGSISGTVTTSEDVTTVSAGAQGYSIPLSRIAPGRFGMSFQIPPIPPLFNGKYTVTLTARNGAGQSASRTLGIALQ